MTVKLLPQAAVPGVRVHVLPQTGSMAVLASCAAAGTIVSGDRWNNRLPDSSPRSLTSTPQRRRAIVRISSLYATGLNVPSLRRDGAAVTLGDLQEQSADDDFTVMLPISMLAPFVATRKLNSIRQELAH